jgi:hypothetical protein
VQGGNGALGTYGGYGYTVSGGTISLTNVLGGTGGNGGSGGDGGQGGAGGEGLLDGTSGGTPTFSLGGLGGPGGDGGASVGGSVGGAGLIVTQGNVTLTGAASGGGGGSGGDGGAGGKGGAGGDGFGGNIGGTGGNGANGSGGSSGGAGLLLSGGTVTNTGSLAGGTGGSGGSGGDGGDGADGGNTATYQGTGADATDMTRLFPNGELPLPFNNNTDATSTYPSAPGAAGGMGGIGGQGGSGGDGGLGGQGAALTGGELINPGSISGGNGGDGGSGGNGGNGGSGGVGGEGIAGVSSVTLVSDVSGVNCVLGGPSFADDYSFDCGDGDQWAFKESPASGGAGGLGGTAGNGGQGGTAGAGSAGVTLQNATVVNTGSILGGNGGNAGPGGTGGEGGTGGAGGHGAEATSCNDIATAPCTFVPGEDGTDGPDGPSGSGGGFGGGGPGGVGVLAQGNANIITAGTIAGGKADGGTGPSADAVLLQGNGNTLTLEAGSHITGAVISQGNNTLALGGDQNAPTGNTFNLTATSSGDQYQGFTNFAKTGSSTWTVNGNGSFSGGTTVSGGTLVMGTGSHLGGNVTIDSGATLETVDANIAWTGTFTNNGAYVSDPSTQTFTTLNIGSSGYLQGGAGDVFDVTNNFFNQSTQRSQWDTTLATLIFSGMPGTSHLSSLAGLLGAGFTQNFGWGTLQLGAGNSLDLTEGSGNAFYVNYLDLQGGLSQLSDLTASSGVVLYYNLDNPQNAYLQGAAYSLEGGGSLMPFVPMDTGGAGSSVPEPGTFALLAAGLFSLFGAAMQRRKVRQLHNGRPL